MSKIRLENVCKHFYRERKRVEVFRDFNVVIESGQLTYIVGDAGSGKTTLVNLITGIERVNNGRIFVDTTELTALDDITSGHFRQEQFGILQRHSFRAGITVQETIEEALHLRSKKDVLTEAEQLLRRVNAYDHRHELATQLSNEDKWRVAIARSLAKNAKILIDDAFASEAEQAAAKIVMPMLREIAQDGHTILVTMRNTQAAECATQIIHLTAKTFDTHGRD